MSDNESNHMFEAKIFLFVDPLKLDGKFTYLELKNTKSVSGRKNSSDICQKKESEKDF